MTDIFPIASKVSEYLDAPTRHQLTYLFNYLRDVENFKNQAEKLGNGNGNVDNFVDVLRGNVM